MKICGNTVGTPLNPAKIKDDTKLDRMLPTGENRLYAMAPDGKDKTYKACSESETGTIPVRNSAGTFDIASPTEKQHCVNKKYVDDMIGDIGTALDELHNYAQALINGGEA